MNFIANYLYNYVLGFFLSFFALVGISATDLMSDVENGTLDVAVVVEATLQAGMAFKHNAVHPFLETQVIPGIKTVKETLLTSDDFQYTSIKDEIYTFSKK